MSLLKVENLTFRRNGLAILENVSFEMPSQQIWGLTGPNGGGKTTLFELILGSRQPSEGSIVLQDGHTLALLPQVSREPSFLPLVVRDFVDMGSWSRFSVPRERRVSVDEALERLNLKDFSKKLVRHLSGGEWKRACLARTLVQSADLYLLDEPFNHLDFHSEELVGHFLKDLVKRGKTFFVVSHDWHAMNHFFDHLLLLNRKIWASGTVVDVGRAYQNWQDPKHHHWMHTE